MQASSLSEAEFAELYGPRTWELLYRNAELLAHDLADHPPILTRRKSFLAYDPPSASSYEQARYDSSTRVIVELAATNWCALFDEWSTDRDGYVFADGYALLFFLRVLWATQNTLLRGHLDAEWTISTTMDRARRRGEAFVQRAEEAAEKFIEAVERLPRMRTYYERGMRHDHKSAVLQHYGFPTTFLDLTFSFDIALFFAELREPGTDPPRHGAIFAIPTYRLPMQSAIVTLPPAIMRPNLQLGKFLDAADPHVVESLEEHKFRFAQRKTQVSNGIGRVGFSTIPGLNDYLFPRSDPLEGIAQPLLDELFNTEVE